MIIEHALIDKIREEIVEKVIIIVFFKRKKYFVARSIFVAWQIIIYILT